MVCQACGQQFERAAAAWPKLKSELMAPDEAPPEAVVCCGVHCLAICEPCFDRNSGKVRRPDDDYRSCSIDWDDVIFGGLRQIIADTA